MPKIEFEYTRVPAEPLQRWFRYELLRVVDTYRDLIYADLGTGSAPARVLEVSYPSMRISWQDGAIRHSDNPSDSSTFFGMAAAHEGASKHLLAKVDFAYSHEHHLADGQVVNASYTTGELSIEYSTGLLGDSFEVKSQVDRLNHDVIESIKGLVDSAGYEDRSGVVPGYSRRQDAPNPASPAAEVVGEPAAALASSQEAPTIFIGHGRDEQWRLLREGLERNGFAVNSYESLVGAGRDVSDNVFQLLDETNFAALVLTGEDVVGGEGDPEVRARQNVVHELGLWQGRYGRERAIMVVENGVEVASNVAGVAQLRFDRGYIGSVVGELLATIRREFPS